jgi:DHA1 family bicyclomycin/chloramphenicol resistance-like MFS transporter
MGTIGSKLLLPNLNIWASLLNMSPLPKPITPRIVIFLLGALSVITPFAIDMYLPAFPQVAKDFNVENNVVALTMSGYFIGLALGQLFYGPLLDRFGRKRPLYVGLSVFVLASLACVVVPSANAMIAARFIQGLGGCVAGIASLAMVHDFYEVKDSANIISRLFLFIAISPLLAPSIGGMIAIAYGWKMVFALLACIVAGIILLMYFFLPEGHVPDTSISLKPGPIVKEYWAIVKHPRFITYALSGAFSFAGLFTYVAGAPIIFMEGFHLSPKAFSGIFALLAMGFIGGSQLNVLLLRRFSSETLFYYLLILQVITGVVFLMGSCLGAYGLIATLALFFIFLACAGMTFPNAAALALAPFTKYAGSASAMLGFLQMSIGALISSSIGIVPSKGSSVVVLTMVGTAALGWLVLMIGKRYARNDVSEE